MALVDFEGPGAFVPKRASGAGDKRPKQEPTAAALSDFGDANPVSSVQAGATKQRSVGPKHASGAKRSPKQEPTAVAVVDLEMDAVQRASTAPKRPQARLKRPKQSRTPTDGDASAAIESTAAVPPHVPPEGEKHEVAR